MNPTLGIFIVILLITLGITYWAARRTSTTADFYAADSQLTAAQNGFALAGDWCSAAAFLGFTGLTALYGMMRGLRPRRSATERVPCSAAFQRPSARAFP